MSNYDRSTHRNDKVGKNRITDNRPAEFRSDDDEQAAYLTQWKINHPHGDIAGYCFLICIGIAMLCVVLTYIKPAKPVAASVIHDKNVCLTCHFEKGDVPKTEKQFKAARKAKIAIRGVDLTELTR